MALTILHRARTIDHCFHALPRVWIVSDWTPEREELERRMAEARKLGGQDKIDRQHSKGRYTVRERIDKLVDPGSFHEIGALAGKGQYDEQGNLIGVTPSNVVMGRARIDGRPVVVTGDDFTVRGGSNEATIPSKSRYPEQMANELRLPIIRIIEGSGGGGSVRVIETTGRTHLPGGHTPAMSLDLMFENMATVPVVALGLGPVAGLGAARLAASHYSVMVRDKSALFVAGPPVVAGLGETLTQQELGGYETQLSAGAVDHAVDTEEEAFAAARRFLSYLPSSVYECAARKPIGDDPNRREEALFSIVPRERHSVYKMRTIIEAIVDRGSFFEMGQMFGRSIITGFARFDGWPVALMASDPFYQGGTWTAAACQKIIRFVDLAQTFHLPIVYLADCLGFSVGLEAERAGTIRHGVRAMAAIEQTTVPWCSIIVRNSFGVAGGAHRPTGRYAVRYAWLSAAWGSLPLAGGIEAAYRAEIDAAPDPAAKIAEIKARLEKLRSPFRSAEDFQIEEIIDPRDTRPLICEFAWLAAKLREPGPSKFGMRP
jgi:acetyl-CoA carboxylase carboxyltransferase component